MRSRAGTYPENPQRSPKHTPDRREEKTGMSRAVHEFRDPARFVVGTVGQPGVRVFFVQGTEAGRAISVRCEKQQAQVLSERMDDMLDEIAAKSEVPGPPDGGDVGDVAPQ